MSRRIALVLGAVGLAAACLETETAKTGEPYRFNRGRHAAALRAINDCPDLEQSLKEQMALRMQEDLEANRQTALGWVENPGMHCWCWDYDGDGRNDACYRGEAYSDPTVDLGGGLPTNDGGAQDYSTTNVQVAGVDEADFIKNDANYVYMVSGEKLAIFDAWPAAEAHIIAQVAIEGWPERLFVDSDRAVVYSDVGQGQSCVYDPYYGPMAAGGQLKITVFDITDRTAPVVEREIFMSGSYASSRRIGRAVHTVVTFPETFELSLATWPDTIQDWDCVTPLTEAEVNAAFDDLLMDNLVTIEAADLGDFLPSATDVDYVGGVAVSSSTGLFVDCQNFYEPTSFNNPGFLSVVSFLLDADTGIGAATIFGRGGEVYASPQNLYVAVKDYVSTDAPYGWGDEITSVHKFGLDNTGNEPWYRGSGEVPGRILNQFAMDEYEGRLRLATTEGYLPSPDVTNNIFVLEEMQPPQVLDTCQTDCEPAGPYLAVVGQINGIGPREDIRAVRYDGDRGFVVTFKKTDPLFAFDLSDPYNPQVTGELHIPGYSTYMHWMDESHLLTIGFDADEQGSFAWFTGIQLQIFDVSDMSQPTLTFKEVIGTRGTTSDATNDHMAFNYYPTRDLLAIPMGICEDSAGGGSYGSTLTFNGLLVYHVTASNGFTLLGGVDHRDTASAKYDCHNWWTNPNSQVKRSIFMEDFVFSISPERMKVNHLPALDVDLVDATLPQGDQPQNPCVFWW